MKEKIENKINLYSNCKNFKYIYMKKNLKQTILTLLSIVFLTNVIVAQNKALQKAQEKQFKTKMKEFKAEGYKIGSSVNSLDVALLEFYEKLKDNKNQQWVVVTENCPTENLCNIKAQNDAYAQYATQASANVKGRIDQEFKADASPNAVDKTAIDKFYAGYEILVSKNIAGAVKKQFAVYKQTANGYKYQTFFLINVEAAENARLDAAKRALEETKVNQEWGNKIQNFIKEGFEQQSSN